MPKKLSVASALCALTTAFALGTGCPVQGGWGDDDDISNDGCVEHTECSADEFCWLNQCELVFGRSYELVMWSADVEPFDASGGNWDVTDAPDPYGVILIGGEEVLETPIVDDSLVADWGWAASAVVSQEPLCIEVWDSDLAVDDRMDSGCFEAPDGVVDFVREGAYLGDLASGLVFVDVEITPNF